MKNNIDPRDLRNLLRYNEDDGKLYWLERPQSMFETYQGFRAWNGKNAGKEAFTALDGHGYRQGRIFKNNYRGHRVVWALCFGYWPDCDIDHIDGDRANNKICNMRLATRSENNMNKSANSNSKSGVKGVFWYKAQGKWQAQIGHGYSKTHLGYFDSIDDAKLAYDAAAAKIYGEFARAI